MNKILFLFTTFLIWNAKSIYSEITEGEILKKFPLQDFSELEFEIRSQFGKKLSYNENIRSMTLREYSLDSFQKAPENQQFMVLKDNIVYYQYSPYSFYFDVTYLYEFNIGIFPITGLVVMRIGAANSIYSLSVAEQNTILPGFQSQWGGRVLKNTSPFAELAGFNDMLNGMFMNVMKPHFELIIQKAMLGRIAALYKSRYERIVNYISYPYLKNAIIKIESLISQFQISPAIGLKAIYGTNVDLQQVSYNSFDFFEKINYSLEIFGQIVQTAQKAIKNVKIYSEDLKKNQSNFIFDLKSIQHIFPDILMFYEADRHSSMSFNVIENKIKQKADIDLQEIIFSDLLLEFDISLEDPNIHLLKSIVNITVGFEPKLICDQNCTKISLNLAAESCSVKIVSANSDLPIEAPFNPSAISGFLKLFIEQHIIKQYKNIGLGNGFVIYSGKQKINIENSHTRITEKNIEIILHE